MGIKDGNNLMKNVVIIDYGMGNLHSISSAIKKLGYNSKISFSEDEILKSSHIILPGVGEFREAMNNLKLRSLDKLIIKISKNSKTKILGICLGMQLLCQSSEEGGKKTLGLGLIKTDVVKLQDSDDYKLPHIGFNEVCFPKKSIFKNKDYLKKDFYFVHSFCLKDSIKDANTSIGHTEYKNRFISFYKKDNLFATQFHPEKSQTNGLIFLKLFLEK